MLRNYLLSMLLVCSIPALGLEMKDSTFQVNSPLTLKSSIELGLENSRAIKKSLMDEEAATYQRKEILGSGLPQVGAYGGYNNFIEVFPQAVPGGLFGPGEPGSVDVIALGVPQSLKAGVLVNQLLFSSSYLIGLKAAKTSEDFYRVLSSKTEEEVIYDIAMNFLGVSQLELQKENLVTNIDKFRKLEKVLQAQVANDMVRKVDLNRVKVNLTGLESDLENLEIGIFQRESYLKLVMGIPIETPISFDKSEIDANLFINSFQVEDLDINERLDIQVLDIQKTLLDYEFKNNRANNHPTLVAFGDLNRNAFSTSFDFLTENKVWYQGFLVGLKLEVPIFDGFVARSKASQSKVRQNQLEQDRSQAEDAAVMEYNNASKKYFNSIRTLKALEENLTLSNDILKETVLLYQEGLSPLTDLLEAESTQRQAQTNYNNQLIQVQIAQVEILKSTGKIKNIIL
jgi:outer membrane protein TolC